MEIRKEIIEGKEYIYIEKYNILGLNVYKFISESQEIIFTVKLNNRYKKIKNKLFLKELNVKFNYNVKTDICESDDEL